MYNSHVVCIPTTMTYPARRCTAPVSGAMLQMKDKNSLAFMHRTKSLGNALYSASVTSPISDFTRIALCTNSTWLPTKTVHFDDGEAIARCKTSKARGRCSAKALDTQISRLPRATAGLKTKHAPAVPFEVMNSSCTTCPPSKYRFHFESSARSCKRIRKCQRSPRPPRETRMTDTKHSKEKQTQRRTA